MSTELVMLSNHLILCHTLLLLPSILPSIRIFSNELALHIRWPNYWSFSISPSKEYSGLISFRMDCLDLLAVQGTLKNLLQYHSSKASILRHSAFFIVQLSHPYMTAGKTIALTRWTFVTSVCYLPSGKKPKSCNRKELLCSVQVSHWRDVAFKPILCIMAHLGHPCLPDNEHEAKTPLFTSQETSWLGPPVSVYRKMKFTCRLQRLLVGGWGGGTGNACCSPSPISIKGAWLTQARWVSGGITLAAWLHRLLRLLAFWIRSLFFAPASRLLTYWPVLWVRDWTP